MTSPVIRCLKQQTQAEIHYLTKAIFLPVLEYNPYLDKIFTIKKKVSEVLPDLKKENYDCIVDLHKNLRTWQVRFGLGFPKTYSFDKLNFEKWLMVNFKINRLPNVHIVDRYLKAVEPLEVKNDGEGLDYFLPLPTEFKGGKLKTDENKITILSRKESKISWINSSSGVGGKKSNYIAFAIGATHATKRLPTQKIVAICQKIKEPVYLIGGKDVAQEGEEIAQQAGEHVQNFCGKCSLHESALLLKNAQKVMTHDTGMMHIAAAFQKEIISIWGNTIPEFGMSPYYKKGRDGNKTLEVKGLSCRPCSKIGHQQCPQGHFKCMMDIDFYSM